VTRECEKVKKLPDCFEISVTATNIAGTSVRANISNSDHHQCKFLISVLNKKIRTFVIQVGHM
jgi:hypothetical protein